VGDDTPKGRTRAHAFAAFAAASVGVGVAFVAVVARSVARRARVQHHHPKHQNMMTEA
jgi:hypothetical protein